MSVFTHGSVVLGGFLPPDLGPFADVLRGVGWNGETTMR